MTDIATGKTEQQSGLYPISTVSQLTGINSVTLRAWERRYGLLTPQRTPSGHRLYSDDDVEQIKNIRQMLDEGISISRVAQALQSPERTATPASNEPWDRYLSQMLLAIEQFNEVILEDVYNEAMSLYPVEVVTRQLLLPLLRQLGERWRSVDCGIAEEHFFSVFMRNKLGARFHHRNRQNTGPRLIIACLPDEQHEFGLLLLALSLHVRGYRLIMLGANMPLEQLLHVAHKTQSDAILLSGSVEMGSNRLRDDLHKLASDSAVPVFVGGPITTQYSDAIQESGAIPLGEDLASGINRLSLHLIES